MPATSVGGGGWRRSSTQARRQQHPYVAQESALATPPPPATEHSVAPSLRGRSSTNVLVCHPAPACAGVHPRRNHRVLRCRAAAPTTRGAPSQNCVGRLVWRPHCPHRRLSSLYAVYTLKALCTQHRRACSVTRQDCGTGPRDATVSGWRVLDPRGTFLSWKYMCFLKLVRPQPNTRRASRGPAAASATASDVTALRAESKAPERAMEAASRRHEGSGSDVTELAIHASHSGSAAVSAPPGPSNVVCRDAARRTDAKHMSPPCLTAVQDRQPWEA